VSTQALIRIVLLGADGTILGTYRGGSLETKVGHPLDASQILGLEAPLKAALAGETDASHLYTMIEPDRRFILAYPVFKQASTEEGQVLGAVVIFFDAFPTRADVPSYIGQIAIRSLLIFVLGVGIMGALFGYIFSHGLASRFNRISAITDLWSEGDFSRYIEDTVGDEISQLAGRLNNMARQLQGLLRRRQEMAVSEERNRLARDLHDSAKQQALAASFELGTALTLYERDPQQAKKHLVEADGLVDAVRKELTNLVDELRPRSMAGQDLSETLKEHAAEWSHRSGIALAIHITGNDGLSVEAQEILFRIAQEALANIARHSSASHAEIFLDHGADAATLTVKDDGRGFDAQAQHAGIGLRSMRERAEAIGGAFSVESTPGQGTQIIVTLPKGK
jgi:signal transduction histidine kinase